MSVKIQVKVLGIDETMRQLNEDVDAFYQRVTDVFLDEVKAFTPVRTGYAQSRWRKNTSVKRPEVSNDAPYVPYLESGTSKMRAANKGRGIIGPALNSTKGKI
jgi:hypothetical protein